MQTKITRDELRLAKSIAHNWFDLLWEEGWMSRPEAYEWLAEQMEMTIRDCHFRYFDVGMCEAASQLCEVKLTEFRRNQWRRERMKSA
jgi:hypothetical protein